MTPAQWYGWSREIDLFHEAQGPRLNTFLVHRLAKIRMDALAQWIINVPGVRVIEEIIDNAKT